MIDYVLNKGLRNVKKNGLTMPAPFKKIIEEYIPYTAYQLQPNVGIKLVNFKEHNLRSVMYDIQTRVQLEQIISKHNTDIMTKEIKHVLGTPSNTINAAL